MLTVNLREEYFVEGQHILRFLIVIKNEAGENIDLADNFCLISFSLLF
jgi:hypothetical protein